jgi:hypothetical protein
VEDRASVDDPVTDGDRRVLLRGQTVGGQVVEDLGDGGVVVRMAGSDLLDPAIGHRL